MTKETKLTKSEEIANEISSLLRARSPLIFIKTTEEARVERYLFEAARGAGYVPRTWDTGQGVAEWEGAPSAEIGGIQIEETLAAIRTRSEEQETDKKERGVWILRDLPVWITGAGQAHNLRAIRNLARSLPGTERETAQAVIVLSPSSDIPPELSSHATVIEWPLPDRDEMASILDEAVSVLPEDVQKKALPNGTRDSAIDAAIGLTGEEAQANFATSLVRFKKIDPQAVAKEKRRVISRDGLLEWFDPLPGGLNAVGGLDLLKKWLLGRTAAFTAKARAFGLQAPKGVLLVGISGCGKSLTAKATATAFDCPLIRVDLGALKHGIVGSSEANIRKIFKIIEAIGRCVVWLDEIEKSLQGATSNSSDGGTSSDQLGAILTWMQERKGEAFVVATANDISALPPELLRKGRFDEVFFVDLPTQEERVAILEATLRGVKRDGKKLDLKAVAKNCHGFTGAEVAELVPEALFEAFNENERDLDTADLVEAAKLVVPLSKTKQAVIEGMRQWAKEGRARRATSQEVAVVQLKGGGEGRRVDLN